MTQQPDVYSPRLIRVFLGVFAIALALAAVFLVDGWLAWVCVAVAIVAGCAAVFPPIRRP